MSIASPPARPGPFTGPEADRLHRFLSLSAGRQRDMARAFVVLASTRLALWLLPFRLFQRIASSLAVVPKEHPAVASECDLANCRRIRRTGNDPDLVQRVAHDIHALSPCVPSATCLVKAVATQILLARKGISSTLRLGVARGAGGEFKAHAWVEWRGRIIVGGEESPRIYAALPRFK